MASLEEQILKKNVPGRYSNWKEEQDDNQKEAESQRQGPLTLQEDKGNTCDGTDDADDDKEWMDDDEEDEFMKNYREQRLNEIKQQQEQQQHKFQQQRQQDLNTVRDGLTSALVPEINGVEYVNMVNGQNEESENEDSLVIILFHDLTDPNTSKLLRCLARLVALETKLRRNTEQRMICKRLDATKTGSEIDPIVLPALLIHQNGTLTHNLTPVVQHLKVDYTISDLHRLLESCDVSLCGLEASEAED